MGHLLTMMWVASNFLCIKNYSSVYKGMSALSVFDQNLEAVSQRGERGQFKYCTALYIGSLLGYSWLRAIQSISLNTHCSLRGWQLHNLRSEIFSSHQQSLLLLRGKQLYFSTISGCLLVLRVGVFVTWALFFHSGGLSKVGYLVLYLWLCVFVVVVVVAWQWTKRFWMCKRRCRHVNRTKSDQFDRCV